MGGLRPSADYATGRVVYWSFESSILAGNPLGDPAKRQHPVYLPPGYEQDGHRRYPVLWSLAAYTNSGLGHVAWRNHGETWPERLDRLIFEGKIPPIICIFPDCYTSLGGNQYVNSPALGHYSDHLIHELVPAVDQAFRTIPHWQSRAVLGKSSGGFGALHLTMRFPETWAAAGSHAGDCGFDRVYVRDFPTTCDVLARYRGDVTEFVRSFWRAKRPGHADFHALMTLCLAASYSPDPDAPLGLALPFDFHTCQVDPSLWARWLSFDPVVDAAIHASELSKLSALWIDVGLRDQYFIHYGSRALHAVLNEHQVAHHYEEFEGSHSGIDWRLDHSIPHLINALATD